MTVLYLILPVALVLAGGAVAAFAWTVRSGQLDDVDTPPRRILFDDEPRPEVRTPLISQRSFGGPTGSSRKVCAESAADEPAGVARFVNNPDA